MKQGITHYDFIDALHVPSAFQRRGIGRRLLIRAERYIAEKGFRQARLETDTFNAQAQAFQFWLDRLQALDVIAWARAPDAIHLTVGPRADALVGPLLEKG